MNIDSVQKLHTKKKKHCGSEFTNNNKYGYL